MATVDLTFKTVDYLVETAHSAYVLSEYDLYMLEEEPEEWTKEIEARLLDAIERYAYQNHAVIFPSTMVVEERVETVLKKKRKWWGVGFFSRFVDWDEPVITTTWHARVKGVQNVKAEHVDRVRSLERVVLSGQRQLRLAEAFDMKSLLKAEPVDGHDHP